MPSSSEEGRKCHPCVRNTLLPISQEGHRGYGDTVTLCRFPVSFLAGWGYGLRRREDAGFGDFPRTASMSNGSTCLGSTRRGGVSRGTAEGGVPKTFRMRRRPRDLATGEC